MSTAVLMYHSLDQDGSVISIAPQDFDRQMRVLHEEGCRVISFSQLVECLQCGQAPPDRSVVITFDDGFSSVYWVAAPILAHYSFPATVFLVAGYCGDTNDWPSQPPGIPRMPLMTWAQVRELEGYGFDFGAHTFTHPRLDQLPSDRLEHELLDSKALIEDRLGHEVELFSYPYGRISQSGASLVAQTYRGACTTRLGLATAKSSPLAIERVDAHYVRPLPMFRALSGSLMPWYLGLRRSARLARSALFHRQWA